MKSKLPESYIRLKQYALLVEDICKDINLHGFGFEPGVLFSSGDYSLDLPEWFLKRLYEYVSAQQGLHPTKGILPAKKALSKPKHLSTQKGLS